MKCTSISSGPELPTETVAPGAGVAKSRTIVEPMQCTPTLPLLSENACTDGGLVFGGLVVGGFVLAGFVGGGFVGGGFVGGGLVFGGLVEGGRVVIAGGGSVVVVNGATATVTAPAFGVNAGVAATPDAPPGATVGTTVVAIAAVVAVLSVAGAFRAGVASPVRVGRVVGTTAWARVVGGVGRVVLTSDRGAPATLAVMVGTEWTVRAGETVVFGETVIAGETVVAGEAVVVVDAMDDDDTLLITKSGSADVVAVGSPAY